MRWQSYCFDQVNVVRRRNTRSPCGIGCRCRHQQSRGIAAARGPRVTARQRFGPWLGDRHTRDPLHHRPQQSPAGSLMVARCRGACAPSCSPPAAVAVGEHVGGAGDPRLCPGCLGQRPSGPKVTVSPVMTWWAASPWRPMVVSDRRGMPGLSSWAGVVQNRPEYFLQFMSSQSRSYPATSTEDGFSGCRTAWWARRWFVRISLSIGRGSGIGFVK